MFPEYNLSYKVLSDNESLSYNGNLSHDESHCPSNTIYKSSPSHPIIPNKTNILPNHHRKAGLSISQTSSQQSTPVPALHHHNGHHTSIHILVIIRWPNQKVLPLRKAITGEARHGKLNCGHHIHRTCLNDWGVKVFVAKWQGTSHEH
jgi:hypothetical protein